MRDMLRCTRKSRWALAVGVVAMAAILLASCSTTKYIPENHYLLKGVTVKSDNKDFDAAKVSQYVHQRGNSRWFSLFKIPLGIYSLSGRDTTKWINRTMRNIGEAPVLYDSMLTIQTSADLLTAMQNMGYMNAQVRQHPSIKGKKATAVYTLSPGEPFMIRSMEYDIKDDTIARLLTQDSTILRLKSGAPFTINGLEQERAYHILSPRPRVLQVSQGVYPL